MFVKITEQPSLHDDLDKKEVSELLTEMNEEDQKVALAVKAAIPQITKLVEGIVPRMKRGGRIFYMGAGTSGRLGVLDAYPENFPVPFRALLPRHIRPRFALDFQILIHIRFSSFLHRNNRKPD